MRLRARQSPIASLTTGDGSTEFQVSSAARCFTWRWSGALRGTSLSRHPTRTFCRSSSSRRAGPDLMVIPAPQLSDHDSLERQTDSWRRQKFGHFEDESLAWLAVVPVWTEWLAEKAGFP